MKIKEIESRLGAVQRRSVAITDLFEADRPIYTMPAANIRAAQAAAEELDQFEGEERRLMAEHIQQLLDAAAEQHEAGCRTEAPQQRNDDLPPAKIKARHPGRRLAAPVEEEIRRWLPAAAGLASL